MPDRKSHPQTTGGAQARRTPGPQPSPATRTRAKTRTRTPGGPAVERGAAEHDAADDPLSVGFLIGLLAGEGHFGGDGRQPHVTLRMHTRHEATFRWLERSFPGGRLYGPYTHGGRSYFQWMARGGYLREHLAPLIHRHRHLLDDYVATRFDTMCRRYTIDLGAVPSASAAR